MKVFKFGVTLLSAAMTAYSPVSMAAMEVAQKNQFNRRIKEEYVGNGKTYNDLYQEKGFLFDSRTRSVLEAWMTVHGTEKVTAPEAQIIKDKNGHESVKLLVTVEGKTMSVTVSETDTEHVEINGVRIPRYELPSLNLVLQKLAEKDSNLKALSKAVGSAKLSPPKKSDMISYSHFDKLPALAKVEYMMRLRETLESAQKVVTESRSKTAQTENSSSHFVLNSYFASLVEQAEADLIGQSCVVAGYLSVYDNPAHNECSLTAGDKSLPQFSAQCDRTEGDVACNPLLYGAQSNGKPFCVRSGTRDFTKYATRDCGNKSPISSESNPVARAADFERILKSYYGFTHGGADAEKIKDCFDTSHRVASTCASMFQPQLESFSKFMESAVDLCGPNSPLGSGAEGTPDQKPTCVELLKRKLDFETFMLNTNILPRPVATVDVDADACAKLPGAKWDGVETARTCSCPDGQMAVAAFGTPVRTYTCPAAIVPSPKDSCKKDNGEESHSFKCSPLPWLIGGGVLLALLWPKGHDDKPKTQPPQPTTIPPLTVVVDPHKPRPPRPKPAPAPVTDVPVVTTTTTVPLIPATPKPPAPPASEGGSGTDPGTNGGVRGTK